jgi:hypothetical protein
MRQHGVTSSRDQPRTRDSEDPEHSDAQPVLARMVPVAGLAVRRRPVEASGPPTIRRTLVDNSGQPPVNITTQAQLSNYPWWNSLSQAQQDHLVAAADDPDVAGLDLDEALAAVPRRALTGGIDLANSESFDLVEQLYNSYFDVVCADPEMKLSAAANLNETRGLAFTAVQDVLQQVAPGARNADIFIIHPGPWITAGNLPQDLQAVMTPGCVAYVLTDNESGSGQAATLVQGLNQLGVFTVTVQTVVPHSKTGLVELGPGPMKVKPYHQGNFRLIRIEA